MKLAAFQPTDRVAENIRARILSGAAKPGEKLESVRVLADRLKHGQATVVRALERLASEGFLVTKDRQGTYVADRTAWRPIPRNVAILTGVPTPFSAGLLSQAQHFSGLAVMQQQLVESGDRVSLHGCVFYPCGPIERRYTPPQKLALDRMDAIVAAGIYELAYLGQLQELKIPVIAYDVDASAVRMDSVFVDEIAAAFQLTTVLLKRAIRRVVFLAGPQNSPDRATQWNYDPANGLREDGYRLAMRQAGVEPEILHADWAGDEVTAALETLPDSAAILISGNVNDPRLTSRANPVAGWSNEPLSAWPSNVVAASRNDQHQMGTATSDLVRWRLEHRNGPIQRRIIRPAILQRT